MINNATFDPVLNIAASVNDPTINAVGFLIINGQSLVINGNLLVTITNNPGDGLIMTNAADNVTVEGNAVFTHVNNNDQATSAGNFTDGVLKFRWHFTQINGSNSNPRPIFASTGTRVVFDGSGTQNISFSDLGTTFSRFQDLSIENTSLSSVNFNTAIIVNGRLMAPGNVTSIVNGAGNLLTVNGGLDVESLILDNVAITVNNGQINRFNNVTFQNHATDATQFTINRTDLNTAFAGLDFQVQPTTGKYIQANDTDGGDPATLTIVRSNSADGSALTATTGGFVVIWTSQLFALNDATTTPEDTPVTINVLGNALNPNGGALTISAKTDGANGTVEIDPGGTTLTYTPNNNFNGLDTFTYTVTNTGEEKAIASVNINVTAVPTQMVSVTPEVLDFGNVVVSRPV